MRLQNLIVIFFSFTTAQAQTQVASDVFQDKLYAYSINHPAQTLFVHFDKNIYLSDENIWFASYLINHLPIKNEILSIGLVDHVTKKLIKTDEFVIANQFSAGKISIPDSLHPGKYDLVCLTDILNDKKPIDIFIQPIEIRDPRRNDFIISITPEGSLNAKNIIIKVLTTRLLPAGNIDVGFAINYKNETKINGLEKTDSSGIIRVLLPDSINREQFEVFVTVNKNHKVQLSSAILNTGKSKKQVRFYPEGGYLIESIPTKVGIQINDIGGGTKIDTAILLQNGLAIDTILTDKNGMAILTVPSGVNSRFSLRVLEYRQYSDFDLPPAIATGVVLKIDTVGPSNSIRVIVQSTGKGKYSMIIHNFKETFGVYVANFAGQASTTIQVSDETLPPGFFTITVIDEKGNPVSERTMFRKPIDHSEITISTPKKSIEKEQKINISVHSNFQKKSTGVFSIACVSSDRIDYSTFRRIDTYEYLYHELSQINSYPQNGALAAADLEKLLLIKGWTRYKLNKLVNTDAADTVPKIDKVIYEGWVKKEIDSRPKIGATLSVFRDSSVSFATSDGEGRFKLKTEDLVTDAEIAKVKMLVNNDRNNDYIISILNPFVLLQTALIDSIYKFYLSGTEVQTAKTYIDTFFVETKILDSVLVKSKKYNEGNFDYLGYHANACGDFVCSEGNINCPVHKPEDPGSHKPVKGKEYALLKKVEDRIVGVTMITYAGCLLEEKDKKNQVTILQGIHSLKDYYMPVITGGTNKNSSTLHWESLKQLSGNDDYVIEFNSGKVAGSYLIIVQGLLNNRPVYQEKMITVE